MDISTEIVELAATEDAQNLVTELSDLALACVGGGCGETIAH